MTRLERQAELAYRKAERESILADGGTPTLSQMFIAEQEATKACDEIDRLDKLNEERLLI